MKKTLVALAVTGAFISGCMSPTPTLQDDSFKGEIVNVNLMDGKKTDFVAMIKGKSLTITLPKLDNNTGENFGKSDCKASFDFVDSYKDSQANKEIFRFSGKWSKANNNCALFVERTSATYSDEDYTRFVSVETSGKTKEIVMSKDIQGRDLILHAIAK